MTNEEQLPSLTPEETEQIENEAVRHVKRQRPLVAEFSDETILIDERVVEWIAGATLYARRWKRDRENAEEVLRAAANSIDVMKAAHNFLVRENFPATARELQVKITALESAIHKKPN